jgi:hypothetical protein
MSRSLDAAVAAELQKAAMQPVLFFEGEFTSGTTRAWTGVGTIVWNGQTWQGVGTFGGFSGVEETGEIRAVNFTVSLDGVSPLLISAALGDAKQGAPGRVWLGMLDSTGALIGTPYLIAAGRLDVPEIEDSGEAATVRITYESRLIDLKRPRIRRYTSEDQKLDYADDLGFDFIPSLQDKTITWGRA